jgi:hypothetical protein
MTPWSSRSFVACLLLLSTACPGDPDPTPAEDSSTGPGTSTGPGPITTPEPSTTAVDTGTSDPDTTAGSSSSSGDPTTDTTGPEDTTGSSSGDSGSSGDSSSSGDPSTGSSSSGDPTTGGMVDCSAGDGPDFMVTNNGFSDYVIDGVNDPPLTVVRGCSYTFTVNAPGHPFLIKSVQGTGVANSYDDGVVGNGTQSGVITWDVSMAAPDALFYNCQFHAPMTGTITVIDP